MNTLLPRNAFLGANWQYQDVKQASTNITFNHQISNNWSLNVITSYQNYTKDYFSTERVQWEYDKNNRLNWKRPLNKTYNEQNYTSFQANVNGNLTPEKLIIRFLSVPIVITALQTPILTLTLPTTRPMVLVIYMERAEATGYYI